MRVDGSPEIILTTLVFGRAATVGSVKARAVRERDEDEEEEGRKTRMWNNCERG